MSLPSFLIHNYFLHSYMYAGRWSEQDLFKKFLIELLDVSSPVIGLHGLDSISRIRIFSHSGGYYTIGNMATVGGMGAVVKELCLLDSLYTDFAQFDAFVQLHLCELGKYRFSSVYTSDGGTYNNNVAMAQRVSTWLNAANSSCVPDSEAVLFVDNNSANQLSVQSISTHPLLFKLMGLSHNDIPRFSFHDFLVGGN